MDECFGRLGQLKSCGEHTLHVQHSEREGVGLDEPGGRQLRINNKGFRGLRLGDIII